MVDCAAGDSMTSRWTLVALALPLLAVSIGASCGAANDAAASGDGPCITPGCLDAASDVPSDQISGDVAKPDADSGTGGAPLAVLCGDGCRTTPGGTVLYPGDADACVGGDPAAGGAGGAAGPLGCAVVRAGDNSPESRCVATGEGAAGDPCVAQADCGPGLACVGQDNAGQCRPYCCSDPEACAVGTFCTPQPLLEPDGVASTPALSVPVCIDAHNCRLDERYPCPEGETCTCATGLACTVVRADGTTGCVEPGTGTDGEACPCAAASETSLGYICSQATHECLKLCAVSAGNAACGAASRCQASASLPEGFGVCTSS